jgi:hypothetical protein
VLIQRSGVLRAATPTVTLPAPDRLALAVPVTLERGEGTASVHFEWDSSGLANAVCADFEVDRTIQGRVLPDAYSLKGGLVLAATDDAVLARPTLQDACSACASISPRSRGRRWRRPSRSRPIPESAVWP